MQQQYPLKGKVALVFGGSRGIGEAIVRRLATDGASVALTYVTSSERAAETVRAAGAHGARVLAIRADSADVEAIKGAVEQTIQHFSRLDIVVVNAGLLMRGAIDAFGLADFDRMVAVNVRGVFAALHFAAPHMEDGGRMITIGSNTAIRSGFPGSSVYSMTKAAVAVLVRGAAIDLAPRRITVNNVQPGPTATDMTAGHADMVKPLIPLGRLGKPAEIGGLVAYLASEEAAFITGSSVTIDGGYVA
ncbi:MAG TPA: SDR family oxidoreductase [Caulobacteraceae bacterium]|nr:SDR family oxidoreductase [Caulobacteraceae bacterium]